jgi:serine/threonine-protein kinase
MKKLKIFFLPVLLSVVFGIGAAAFLLQEKTVRENNYQTFLTSAETCIEKEEALEFYRRAIKLNPEREEAYLLSLKNIFLEDGVLSEEESVQLRGLLNCCDEKGVFAEQYFRENEEGYALFSYEAGIAYFYKYEDKSNKKNARKYFETAASSEMLEEKKRTHKWLAEQIGKDPATVSKWCTNTLQPNLETIVEIAKLLEVDIKDLFRPINEQ